ncbi:hypothetical protein SAMCCGM7_Ch3107 [Sinorhizobium americanum CCGM7]|nr:hypothetical protein SAMCCGM7_Ch3107 [Sinorhizobium americanum CCGM7]
MPFRHPRSRDRLHHPVVSFAREKTRRCRSHMALRQRIGR